MTTTVIYTQVLNKMGPRGAEPARRIVRPRSSPPFAEGNGAEGCLPCGGQAANRSVHYSCYCYAD